MFRLDLKRLPYWVDLGLGVKVEVLPFGTEVELRSRDLPEDLRAEMAGDTAVKSLAVIKAFGRAAIIGWSGLEVDGREENGPWPEGIDALLSTSPFGATFSREYVGPALLAVSEKNASASSPAGTSATDEATAPPAPGAAPSAPPGSKPH